MVRIALDYRTGSKELAPLFLPYGIQVDLRCLSYGDLAFEGNGPRGRCAVVIERKQIGDLVDSIKSRRLSGHQLPGMADEYDYCYLIVEGVWKPGPDGELIVGHGSTENERSYGGSWSNAYSRLRYRALDNYLATLELHAGVIYRRTLSPTETVAMVVDLYRWWNDKLWEEHSSHLAVYAPAEIRQGKSRFQLVKRPVTLCEKWAMQLEGVDSKAEAVAQHFGSGRAMALAGEREWMAIRGIGKLIAKRAVQAIASRI
jgi:ERCC4-type nuclease